MMGVMLNKLNRVMEALPNMLSEPRRWKSLIVNRRKPHTFRAFTQFQELRVCLHRFEMCDELEAFRHPHGWAGAFEVMGGYYRQKVWYSESRIADPCRKPVIDMILGPGSQYEISNPLTWHSVQPLSGYDGAEDVFVNLPESAWTVMVNGEPWDADTAHVNTVTTKGKDLDKLTPEQMTDHLRAFQCLMEDRWRR